VLIFCFSVACRWWADTDNQKPGLTPFITDELKSKIPFSTKEPEQFQTELVVKLLNNAERRTFLARNGNKQRFDFNFGTKHQITSLQTDKNYLVLPEKKIYTEVGKSSIALPDEWTAFLTTVWLNQKYEASFEKLETSASLTKYRVRIAESGFSEVLIYIDEAFNLPVRQEFFSGTDERKNLIYTVELKNLKLQTEESLFALPTDFRKVPEEELRKILQSEK
jgi:hypothetical protein